MLLNGYRAYGTVRPYNGIIASSILLLVSNTPLMVTAYNQCTETRA